MARTQTKLFKSNRSQAVRLSKAVALPDSVTEVEIIAVGDTRIITPARETWHSWFDGYEVSDDFMAERDEPQAQDREDL